MWPIILSSIACVAPTYFSTCHKRHDFQKSYWIKKCVLWFSLQFLSARFLILRWIPRDNALNVHRYSCKVPVILVRFPWNFNFLDGFSNNRKISWKAVRTGVFFFLHVVDTHAEANRRFWNFANAPKKWHRYFTCRVYRSEGSSCSAGHEIPRTLLMPKVHYRVHKTNRNACALCYGDITCKLVAPRTKPAVAPSVPVNHVSPSHPRLHDEEETSFLVWSTESVQKRQKKYFSSDQPVAYIGHWTCRKITW